MPVSRYENYGGNTMTEQEVKEVGLFLIKLRESKNWSQREAANALGVSNSFLSQIESGSRELSLKLQRSIPKVFDCPDDWVERIHEIKIETVEEKILRLEEHIERYAKIRDVLFSKLERRGVFIIGDLCMDDIELPETFAGSRSKTATPVAGGKGLNSAIAFEAKRYIPVIFGGVGKDSYGQKIINKIENVHHIISLIKEYAGKQTGETSVSLNKKSRINKYKHAFEKTEDANDFPVEYLREMLEVSGINKEWYIYFIATVFQRYKFRHLNYLKFEEYEKNGDSEKNPFEFYRQDFTVFAGGVMGALYATGAPVIVRVPQEVDHLNLNEFNLFSRVDFLIGEYLSFVEIFKNENGKYNITEENEDGEIIKENIQRIVKHIDGQAGQYLMFFYGGTGNIDRTIFGRRTANGTFEILEGPGETGYAAETDAMKRIGFIDRFIAGFIWEHDPRNPAAEKKWHWEWPKREK
jgi:transcriptional regulator with XRE-family HTH domain